MKHVDNIATLIKSLVLLIRMFVIGMSFVGCVAEDMGDAGNGGNILLKFRLNSSAPATRSADGGELPGIAGEDAESRIDLNDIWIGVFNADGDLLGVAASPVNGDSGSSVAVESVVVSVKEIEINCGDLYVVALANCGGYGISADQLNGISKAEDLCKLVFSYPSLDDPIEEGELLPMYGYSEITVSPEMRYLEIDVELRRSLAKIVINDCMEGDVRIESVQSMPFQQSGNVVPDNCNLRSIAQMNDHTSVDNMPVDKVGVIDFIKREDEYSRIFYLYLPEIKLGDDTKGEDRKITLKLSDGTSHDIYIAHHNSGEPEESSLPEWNSLLRNYVYRFNVKGELSSEPEIEIQRKIRVCWYITAVQAVGKFNSNFDCLHLLPGDADETTKSLNSGNHEAKYQKLYVDYFVEYEMEDVSDFETLQYVLTMDRDYDSYYDFNLVRNLKRDVVKYENIGNVTYCWLTTETLGQQKIEEFPENMPIRIYWTNKGTYDLIYQPPFEVSVEKSAYSSGEIISGPTYKGEFDNERDLYYVDVYTKGGVSGLNIKISRITNNKFTLTTASCFKMVINGKDHVVFHVNGSGS